MLEFKNNLLSYSGEIIKDNNTVITLTTDLVDAPTIYGQLKFQDGSSLLVKFTSFDNGVYKTKLQLKEDIKSKLKDSVFRLVVQDINVLSTNYITFNFDIDKIDFSLKENKSTDILRLQKDLSALEAKLNHVLQGHIITNVTINNLEYIKKGMILQAIDDKGNFIATYPFSDMVKEINGQKPINNSIILDASMIKYNQEVDVKTQLLNTVDVLGKLNDSIISQGNLIKDIVEDLNALKQKIDSHINDGIV